MVYLLIAFIIIVVVILAKNNNTYENQKIIIDAVYAYRVDCFMSHVNPSVDWSDIEDYDTTMYRWLDWGYENILPADKFEVVKPYIKK